jgi:Ca2+/Na+ antiporter
MAPVVSFLKRFLAVLFALLLFVNLLAVSVLFPAQSVLLDKNTWLSALEKTDWYSVFVPIAVEFLDDSLVSGIGAGMHPATEEAIVREAFSREWLDGEMKKIVSNYFDFVDGKTETLDFSVSLQEPKQKLPGVLSSRFGLDPIVEPLIASFVNRLPEKAEIVPESELRPALLEQRALVSLLHQLVLALLVLAVAFAVLVAALLQNKSVLLVFGIVFLLAGILLLLASQLIVASVPRMAETVAGQLQAGFRSDVPVDAQGTIEGIAVPFSNQVAGFGIAETIAGLGCLAWFWLRSGQKPVKSA